MCVHKLLLERSPWFGRTTGRMLRWNLLLLFSHSVMSNSLWLHGLQLARLPCPSPSPNFAQTHVHWVDDAIQLSHLLWSPSPPALNLSQYQCLFQWVSSLHKVAKYWRFSFSVSPSSEYSGLISFGIDRFDILAVQGTLKSSPTPQFKGNNSSVFSLFYYPGLTSIHD